MSLSARPLVVRCCVVAALASLSLVGPAAAGGHRCELETLKDYCLSYGECQWNWAGYCDPPSGGGQGAVASAVGGGGGTGRSWEGAGSTASPPPSSRLGAPTNDSTACNSTQRLIEAVVPGCQFCESVAADQVCRVRDCKLLFRFAVERPVAQGCLSFPHRPTHSAALSAPRCPFPLLHIVGWLDRRAPTVRLGGGSM